MKILTVFGTRPEAVKMAPIVRLLAQTPGVESRVCVTAQHRQMLDQVLNLFEIKPDYDLNLMREGQTLADISAAIFTSLNSVLTEFNPDWVLVVGDTTTVVTTSLLAFYNKIKVGHVEAGLRTHDKWHPFPEEINRRLATVIADLHFAPTDWSRTNLLQENIPDHSIVVTGNPVVDALNFVAKQPEPPVIKKLMTRLGIKAEKPFDFASQPAPAFGPGKSSGASPGRRKTSDELAETQPTRPAKRHTPILRVGNGPSAPRHLVLVTAHRRENFGEPMENICLALKQLAGRGDVEIVYPVHLNPNVQEPVKRILKGVDHITLVPPVDYLPLVHLMKRAKIILTDSGGIQEEAPALGIPVLVMRDVTERPEGVAAGTLKLVGTDSRHIVREAMRLLDSPSAYAKMAKASNPFGDGHAAERIVQALQDYLS